MWGSGRALAVALRWLVLLVGLLAGAGRATAAAQASVPHLKVALQSEAAALTPGQAQTLALRFELEEGWHIYWSNPGDSGQAPRVSWRLPAGLRAGDLKWPTPHRLSTPPLVNYGYEGTVMLLAPLSVASTLGGVTAMLEAEVGWLVCREECIPGKARLALTLPVGAAVADAARASLFAAARRSLPVSAPESLRLSGELDAAALVINAHGLPGVAGAQLFPLDADQIDNAAPQALRAERDGFSLALKRSEQLLRDIDHLRGVLVLSGGAPLAYVVDIPLRRVAASAGAGIAAASPEAGVTTGAAGTPSVVRTPPAARAVPTLPLWVALLLALAGGALLNLMPCVFPVLSLKILGLVEHSGEDRARARRHGLAYSAGILVSFWLLAGLLIVLRHGGRQSGWGFQLQSPAFLSFLAALLFLLGLNLVGVFELGLSLTRLGGVSHGRAGVLGAFGTGVLATVVATPCTAPFMGTAVGFALSQPALPALAIFTALGLGLALPYLLLLYLPGLRRALPRPGAWMETFKQLMGFLLFGTVVWLTWVLGVQTGTDGVVVLLAGLLVVALGTWVLHRDPMGSVASLLGWGLILAGGLAPSWQVRTAAAAAALPSAQAEGDLPWERFSPALVAQHRQSGRAVLVDFTAAWCVSCQVNERLVLRAPAVRERLHGLKVATLKADWTNYDPVITEALAGFGRSGVPCYVLYPARPEAPPVVLPEVLSTGLVLEALAAL